LFKKLINKSRARRSYCKLDKIQFVSVCQKLGLVKYEKILRKIAEVTFQILEILVLLNPEIVEEIERQQSINLSKDYKGWFF
jgi:hypothetical protein